jgi:hypothetical protein
MNINICMTYVQFACCFSTLFFCDGVGWLIFRKYAKLSYKGKLLSNGISALSGGACLVISASLYNYNNPTISAVLLFVGVMLELFAGIGWYKIKTGYWKPFDNNHSYAIDSNHEYHYDFPEDILILIVFIGSVTTKMGCQLIYGSPKILWIIGCSIAYSRCLDPVAMFGIAAEARVRLIVLWISRLSIAIAIILKYIEVIAK